MMFHMAGVALKYRDQLKKYLTDYCALNQSNALRVMLTKGIHDDNLFLQLEALSLCNRAVTGPWMTEFYSNKCKLSNLPCVPKLKMFSTNIENFAKNPQLVHGHTDIFGNPLSGGVEVPAEVPSQAVIDDSPLFTCLSALLKEIGIVGCRQTKRYITGDLSLVTEDMVTRTQHSQPHNLEAERLLGMVDAEFRRGHQQSISLIEARVVTSKNKTLDWLQAREDKESLVRFAMKEGRKVRADEIQQRKDVQEAGVVGLRKVKESQDMDRRRGVESEVHGMMKGVDAIEDIKKMEGYATLSPDNVNFCNALMNKRDLDGREFLHTWTADDGEDETYFAKVEKTNGKRKDGLKSYTVVYWLFGSEEGTATKHPMLAEKLVCDILYGDLSVPME